MQRIPKMICLLAVIAILATASQSLAENIKERMRARLPVIVDLKAQGVLGENNQGYLTLLKKRPRLRRLVDEENADRSKIYNAIAKKQRTSPEQVGQRRALQIAQKADPGTWIQGPKGKWHRK